MLLNPQNGQAPGRIDVAGAPREYNMNNGYPNPKNLGSVLCASRETQREARIGLQTRRI